MNTISTALVAAVIAVAATVNLAQARTGHTGGYYVTECKTVETSPKVKSCTLAGCKDVYLPVRKAKVCTKKWVNPNAV